MKFNSKIVADYYLNSKLHSVVGMLWLISFIVLSTEILNVFFKWFNADVFYNISQMIFLAAIITDFIFSARVINYLSEKLAEFENKSE